MAVPLIKNKENVLVSSPTGSGKTLTAFLSILNDFFKKYRKMGCEAQLAREKSVPRSKKAQIFP